DDEAGSGSAQRATESTLLGHVDRRDSIADLGEHAVDVEAIGGEGGRRDRRRRGRAVVVGDLHNADGGDGRDDGAGETAYDPGSQRRWASSRLLRRCRRRQLRRYRPESLTRGRRTGLRPERLVVVLREQLIRHALRLGRRPPSTLELSCGLAVGRASQRGL